MRPKAEARRGSEMRAFFQAGYRAAGGRLAGGPSGFPRRVRRRWRWRRTLLAFALAYAALALVRQEVALHRLAAEAERYELRIEDARAEADALRERLSELASPAAVEREARGMGLTKPGEIVFEPLWPSR
ncbi:MAG: septum formation initiator family protein [Clostridia bacterium]|nr:septum formation initiator family protein [Clostridia bacterium]